jgi:hypothetical protein
MPNRGAQEAAEADSRSRLLRGLMLIKQLSAVGGGAIPSDLHHVRRPVRPPHGSPDPGRKPRSGGGRVP